MRILFTGNANGPLGGYLVKNKIVKDTGALFVFNSCQGEKMGRFGTIEISVKVENHIPTQIQIKGEATVVFKAEIII